MAASASPASSRASPDSSKEKLPESRESPLYGALDRFGQFFIAPLFLADTVDRELKAVDSENKKNLQNDGWRLHQLSKSLCNPAHPYCHFSTGSWKTLHDDPIARGVNIRDAFIKFYKEHYSANRMKLAVLGRETLDVLEEWADDIFSQVPNHDLPQLRWDHVPVYTENELLIQAFAKPVTEQRRLDLEFLFRDEDGLYESHPSRYLGHLIGHEGPGSILAYIKAQGWANGLSAGATTLCPGSGVFTISVKLTEEGLRVYRTVVKVMFQYLAMLREKPPQEWVVDELMRMSEVDFRFRQKRGPSKTTSRLSSVMQKPLPRNLLLSAPARIRKFDADAIGAAMSFLRPDNFRLGIVSQEFPGNWDKKEKWYGTEYRYEKMPDDFVAEVRSAFESSAKERPAELHFPHENLFIPERLDVERKEVKEPAKSPCIIRHDDNVRVWYKKDDQFWVPKANVNIFLRTPVPHMTARTMVMSSLFRELVNDALAEYSYDADISGLVYDFASNDAGLAMSVEGYNDKLSVLLEKVLLSIRDLEVRSDRFDIMKDRMTRSLRNWDFAQPWHQVATYTRWLRIEKGFLAEDMLDVLPTITAADIAAFYPLMLAQLHIEMLAHGNLQQEEALQLAALIETTLNPYKLRPSNWVMSRNFMLPSGSNFIYERPLKDPAEVNNCIEYSLYIGKSTDRTLRARIMLLAQMADEPTFNQLRTIEQLGYVTFSGGVFADSWAGFRVLVQSERDCRYLEGRIEAFLTGFEATLEKMDDDEFEANKRSIINKRLEKLKNLTQEGDRFWNHIANEAYDFEQGRCFWPCPPNPPSTSLTRRPAYADAAHVQPLTKPEMVAFYRQHISPASASRAKLAVHMVAQATAEPPTPQQRKADAASLLGQLLAADAIDAPSQPDALAARLDAVALDAAAAGGEDAAAADARHGHAILAALEAHLRDDVALAPHAADAVVQQARAALGLARSAIPVPGPGAGANGSTDTAAAADKAGAGATPPPPVFITDVFMWKAGLQLGEAAKPVCDLDKFVPRPRER